MTQEISGGPTPSSAEKSFLWSEDGQRVAAEGETIRIGDLSTYIRNQVLKAAECTLAIFELLQLDPASTTFHSDPSSLRHDASAASTGWTHPANVKVRDASMEFRRAAIRYCAQSDSMEEGISLDSASVKALITIADKARRAALLAIFVSSGHCPRVQDLLLSTFKNQFSSMRDLKLGPDGQLSLLLGSNKTGYRSNIVTARFCSPLLSDVVGTLTTVVRPALDQIRALSSNVSPDHIPRHCFWL
ncbi:hypothetical protein A4X13_0g7076 [Tilletia indica]|uniref:Uncharacterized protein n=1 Tax=Tilletia indica TaxID=43049 RepID=A0A177TEK1_9BASI|nr:hypothetical protein A4X13_0g7076 [Tilletia indica]